jgi:hypothetical protein
MEIDARIVAVCLSSLHRDRFLVPRASATLILLGDGLLEGCRGGQTTPVSVWSS